MSIGVNIIADHQVRLEVVGGLLSKLEATNPALDQWERVVLENKVSSEHLWTWAWRENFETPESFWNEGNVLTAFIDNSIAVNLGRHAAYIQIPIIWSALKQKKIQDATNALAKAVIGALGGHSMLVVPSSSAYCAEMAANGVSEKLPFEVILENYQTCRTKRGKNAEEHLLWLNSGNH